MTQCDSTIADFANFGGTKIIETFAPVVSTASLTVLKTGFSRCTVPPLPGVTPATIFVPYLIICSEWKVPSEPVKPWTITFEFLLIKMLIKKKCTTNLENNSTNTKI